MVKCYTIIKVRSKSSIDALHGENILSIGDTLRFKYQGKILTGYITRYKGKIYIQKDSTLLPSIPVFLQHYTGIDYLHDPTWQRKVTINDVPYLELHRKLPKKQKRLFHAKIGLVDTIRNEDGSLFLVWHIENDGNEAFPSDTIMCYRDSKRDNHSFTDIHIGALRSGESRYVGVILPKEVHTNGYRIYRWKLLASQYIYGSHLFYIKR